MSKKKKISATARVQLTVEIDVGPWDGAQTSFDALYAQVAKEALESLRIALQNTMRSRARIVGEPHVKMVLVEETT